MVLQTLIPLAVLASSVVPARAVRGPEIVIASEALVAGGAHVPENLAAFLRRLETVGGWPAGSLRGKTFTRPREALAYIRANKVPFAILPPHQLVEARKDLKLEIVGRAVGMDGTRGSYWGVAPAGKRAYEHIEEAPGLRLALTETYDEQWLRVLLEGNVSAPAQHFKLLEVTTAADAVAAVLARKADVAMVSQSDFAALKPRLAAGGDLAWVYASEALPPSAIVSVNRHAPPAADRKRFTTALEKLCKGEGGDACARMGILYVEVGKADSYNIVIQKYARFR
jgi:ABC-type phosphate/phosphonate transport system substrate-binding protein